MFICFPGKIVSILRGCLLISVTCNAWLIQFWLVQNSSVGKNGEIKIWKPWQELTCKPGANYSLPRFGRSVALPFDFERLLRKSPRAGELENTSGGPLQGESISWQGRGKRVSIEDEPWNFARHISPDAPRRTREKRVSSTPSWPTQTSTLPLTRRIFLAGRFSSSAFAASWISCEMVLAVQVTLLEWYTTIGDGGFFGSTTELDLFLFIFERKSAALRIVISKKNINGLRRYIAPDKLWFVLILNSRMVDIYNWNLFD